jgi:hypothetical protein
VTKQLENIAKGLKQKTVKFSILNENQLTQRIATFVENDLLQFFK